MSAGLNRRQRAYCRARAQGEGIAASARVAGCAESTAHVWEARAEVVAEIAALRGAAAGTAAGEATDDLESILRRSIAQCERRGDHRGIAQLVDKLRLVQLETRRTNGLVEQLRAATPDELVDALSRSIDDPQTWSRIANAAHDHSMLTTMGATWLDAHALALSGVWLRDEHRDAWRDQTAQLFSLAGALVRHPSSAVLPSQACAEVRQAISDARAALDSIEVFYTAPTDAADTEPAH